MTINLCIGIVETLNQKIDSEFSFYIELNVVWFYVFINAWLCTSLLVLNNALNDLSATDLLS